MIQVAEINISIWSQFWKNCAFNNQVSREEFRLYSWGRFKKKKTYYSLALDDSSNIIADASVSGACPWVQCSLRAFVDSVAENGTAFYTRHVSNLSTTVVSLATQTAEKLRYSHLTFLRYVLSTVSSQWVYVATAAENGASS